MKIWRKKTNTPAPFGTVKFAPISPPNAEIISLAANMPDKTEWAPHELAVVDQNNERLRRELAEFGIAVDDPGALHCVAVGFILMDMWAMDLEAENGEAPMPGEIYQYLMSALVPLVERARDAA